MSNCVGNPDLDSYFDAVYAETFNSVSKFVVSHAARFQDSEDIIQNVYTRFYKRISEKGFADIESAEAFLINIACSGASFSEAFPVLYYKNIIPIRTAEESS